MSPFTHLVQSIRSKKTLTQKASAAYSSISNNALVKAVASEVNKALGTSNLVAAANKVAKRPKKSNKAKALGDSQARQYAVDYSPSIPRPKVSSVKGRPMVSECVRKFVEAVVEPWAPSSTEACIPLPPCQPSHKVTAYVRFDGKTGDEGVGYIAITPCIANDSPSVFYTDNSGTGYPYTDVEILAAANIAIAGVAHAAHNGPYGGGQFKPTGSNGNNHTSDLRGRVVACACTVQFTGKTIDQSGLVYCDAPSAHINQTWDGPNSSYPDMATLGARLTTHIEPFQREKCSLSLYPTIPDECVYNPVVEYNTQTSPLYPLYQQENSVIGNPTSGAYWSASYGRVAPPIGLIMINAAPAQPFHCEMVLHLEFTGPIAASSSTPNVVDRPGFESSLAALSTLASDCTAQPHLSPLQIVRNNLVRNAMKLKAVAL